MKLPKILLVYERTHPTTEWEVVYRNSKRRRFYNLHNVPGTVLAFINNSPNVQKISLTTRIYFAM